MADTRELKQKALDLVEQYADALSEVGMRCTVRQKYREEEPELDIGRRRGLFRKRQEEKYRRPTGRYKVLVLSFTPGSAKRRTTTAIGITPSFWRNPSAHPSDKSPCIRR